MDCHRARLSIDGGFYDLDKSAVTSHSIASTSGSHGMAKLTPHPLAAGTGLNVMLWVVIVVVALGIGVWTVWASRQPDVPSIWAPD